MKIIRLALLIVAGLFASLNLHAQTAMVGSFNRIGTPIQTAPPDSIVQVTAEAQGLSLVAPEDLPPCGTFWLITSNGVMAPLPSPLMDANLPTYYMADGQFLVDGTDGQVAVNTRRLGMQSSMSSSVDSALTAQATAIVNLINQAQGAQVNREFSMAMGMGVPTPGDGGDSGGGVSPNGLSVPMPDYGTNLWIAQTAVASGYLTGIGMNTAAALQYEIQSRTNLLQMDWQSEGFIYGSEITNWTPLSVAQNGRTDLFLRLRLWGNDGSGLPDWWQEQYFGVSSGVDPYADPAGDGWSNYQKFQLGWNPNQFYTPAAPQLAVSYGVFSGLATVSWTPKLTPAMSYTVKRFDYEFGNFFFYSNTFNLSGTIQSLQDNMPAYAQVLGNDPAMMGGHTYYQIQAHYAVGDSAWSAPVYVKPDQIASISMVPGPQGSAYLAVASLPAGTAALRVTRIDYGAEDWNDYSFNATNDIPVSASTNGLYLLPSSITANPIDAYGAADYAWYVEPVNGSGQPMGEYLNYEFPEQLGGYSKVWVVPPYFDGRIQLKQNLVFKLRAATVDSSFKFSDFNNSYGYQPYFANQSNYVSASYSEEPIYYLNSNQKTFDPLWPFAENTLFQNFVFSLADAAPTNYVPYGIGHLTTGDGGSYDNYYTFSYYPTPLILTEPATYQFALNPTNGGSLPALLPAGSTRWLGSYPLDSSEMYYDAASGNMLSSGYLEQIGVTPSAQTDWQTYYNQIYTMASNARNYWGLPFLSVTIAYANTANTATETTILNAGSQEVNVDGYFYPETAQPQFQTVEYDFWNQSPLPESTNFSTANPSELLITPVGSSIIVNGYAKLALQNGYSGVYAYLGQYFDKAYKIDTNGNTTANQTGVLSPYGNFFATEPGPAVLVTMPDLDPPYQRGTGVVNCISMPVDKNADGNMDLSFNGPDATSLASPMVAWVNNGYIQPGSGGSLDQDMPQPPNHPEYTNYNAGRITCQRDLENFFRLWICGVPTLAFSNGYSATITCTAITGTPAINIYAAETNGSTLYLTDTNTAQSLVKEFAMGTAGTGSGQTCILPNSFFDGKNKYLLFEGAGIGEGQFTLTIYQGTTAIAQTSIYIDLHDIKGLYEQARATNVTSGLPPSSLVSQFQEIRTVPAAQNESKQIVVFVHGINNADFDASDSTETIFKRLYWSGYHGRVAEFKWPCAFLPNSYINPAEYLKAFNFDKGEFYAWKSASALKDYLNYLRNRPDLADYQIDILAHSQGNIVASEAVKQGAPFDNFILTQAAVPAHCYDTSVPFQQKFLDAESSAPTPLYTTNGGYHGYFANLTGNLISFYNTNDFALISGTLASFDVSWEKDQVSQKPENYDYLLSFGQTYYYHPSAGNSVAYYTLSQYTVIDMQEAKAMVARSRTHALGAQDNIHGVISSSVDLKSSFGFDKTRDDHSAQFNWPIQRVWNYYDQMLISFNIQHINR